MPNPFPTVFSYLSWRNSNKSLQLARSNSSPKLSVQPVVAFPGPLDEMVCISVADESTESAFGRIKTYVGIVIKNEGFSPQRIIEAGFADRHGVRHQISDSSWIDAPDRIPVSFDQPCQGFPIRLDPTESAGIYLMLSPCPDEFLFHEKAYVELDSGVLVFGVSQVASKFANQIRACLNQST